MDVVNSPRKRKEVKNLGNSFDMKMISIELADMSTNLKPKKKIHKKKRVLKRRKLTKHRGLTRLKRKKRSYIYG